MTFLALIFAIWLENSIFWLIFLHLFLNLLQNRFHITQIFARYHFRLSFFYAKVLMKCEINYSANSTQIAFLNQQFEKMAFSLKVFGHFCKIRSLTLTEKPKQNIFKNKFQKYFSNLKFHSPPLSREDSEDETSLGNRFDPKPYCMICIIVNRYVLK